MRLGTALLLATAIWFAQMPKATPEGILKGILIYGWGDSIHEVLVTPGESLKSKVIYHREGEQISGLSMIDQTHFLFSETFRNKIDVFDRATEVAAPLADGVFPVVVPQQEKVFFYQTPSGSTHLQLSVAHLSDPMKSARVIDSGEFPVPLPVVRIENEKIVFQSSTANGGTLKLVDTITDSIVDLGIHGCAPKIWRARTKELLCFDASRAAYELRDLAGRYEHQMDWPPGIVAIAYLQSADALLLGYEQGSQHWIGVFRFDVNRVDPILNDIIVGTGGAIWIPLLPSL